jgi:DNA-binding response OmpR family regulator
VSSAPPRRVLVVEDERAIRELLRPHLELAGFVLEEAGDGRRGLDAARARPFDLILLDVMLPGLDGVSGTSAPRSGRSRHSKSAPRSSCSTAIAAMPWCAARRWS